MPDKNTVEDSHYRDDASSGSVKEASKEEAQAADGQIGQHLHKRYQAGNKHEAQK